MRSIFAETIARAISDYRILLRRYLTQKNRLSRLEALNLKDPNIYESDIALHRAASAIIKDIEENIDIPKQNYYSYSGVATFCEYLKEYLSHYEVDGDNVTHKARKASRALIEAIQLATLPEDQLRSDVAGKLEACNAVIATCGSKEQCELHQCNLERQQMCNENFYTPILNNFQELLHTSQADTMAVSEGQNQ